LKSKLNNKSRKAQFFSSDLVIAIIIFIILMTTIIWLWEYTHERIFSSEKTAQIDISARIAISSLIETQGNPKNWSLFPANEFTEANVHSIGLGKTQYLDGNNQWSLDSQKISRLASYTDTNSSYSTTKKILGLSNPDYEFYLAFNKWNGSSFAYYSSSGISASANSTGIISIERYALIDGEKAIITLMMWKK